jgi:DNA-binding IclR family transcriptional regulator
MAATPPARLLGRLQQSCLAFLAANPGACNLEISAALGIRHPSQTSRLMRRLEAMGLVTASRSGARLRWTTTRVAAAAHAAPSAGVASGETRPSVVPY